MDKTLNEVYLTEKKAEEIKQKAQKEAESMLAESRNAMMQKVTETQEIIDKEREKIIEDHQKKLRINKEKMIKEGILEIEKIKSKAMKKAEDASEFVIGQFKNYIK